MNVGSLIPPVILQDEQLSLKANLEQSAVEILTRINALVPEEDLQQFHQRLDETYQLEIRLNENGSDQAVPDDLQVQHGAAYARFLFNPTMMDVLYRNLHLPIEALTFVDQFVPPGKVLQAWTAILDYLDINPGYFTYRFGVQRGVEVKQALQELVRLGQFVQEFGCTLSLTPILRYRNPDDDEPVTERGGRFPKSMLAS